MLVSRLVVALPVARIGLLDECPLTLSDIKKLAASFRFTLLNMLHSRIAYPQDDDKGRPAERPAAARA